MLAVFLRTMTSDYIIHGCLQDDDTYVFMNTLWTWLQAFDPHQPLYLGAALTQLPAL